MSVMLVSTNSGGRWAGAYIVRDGFDSASIGRKAIPIDNNALLIDDLEPGVTDFVVRLWGDADRRFAHGYPDEAPS